MITKIERQEKYIQELNVEISNLNGEISNLNDILEIRLKEINELRKESQHLKKANDNLHCKNQKIYEDTVLILQDEFKKYQSLLDAKNANLIEINSMYSTLMDEYEKLKNDKVSIFSTVTIFIFYILINVNILILGRKISRKR